MSNATLSAPREAADNEACSHLNLMPTNAYTNPENIKIMPPIPKAGVILGGIGSWLESTSCSGVSRSVITS